MNTICVQYEHNLWAFKLYFCELLNFVNVVFQICLTDKFLGGSFSQYGLEVFSWSDQDPEGRVDPMSRFVFSKMKEEFSLKKDLKSIYWAFASNFNV